MPLIPKVVEWYRYGNRYKNRKPYIPHCDFLSSKVIESPKFDEMIFRDIRETDSLFGYVPDARLVMWNRILTWISLGLKGPPDWFMPKQVEAKRKKASKKK